MDPINESTQSLFFSVSHFSVPTSTLALPLDVPAIRRWRLQDSAGQEIRISCIIRNAHLVATQLFGDWLPNVSPFVVRT